MYSANYLLGEILQNSVFLTRSAHRLQLEPLSGCNKRGITISGVSAQYLQLEVYIDCNSNYCPVATKGVLQISGGSTQYLQLGVYIDCNSNYCPVATEVVVHYQAGALSICNLECISIATRTTVRLQLEG
jgi:hypothetical protein